MAILLHGLTILALTVVTQLGGVAWIIAVIWRRQRRWFWAVFLGSYVALSAGAVVVAPWAGRQVVGCWGDGPVQAASPIYCALNRSYVTPALAQTLADLGTRLQARHPGTVLRTLDGSFPFTTMPLLPHLSHDDGEKMDLAFYYADGARDALRSPLGYFAFEDGPTDCPAALLTLRWDLAWLQPAFRDLPLDATRMRTLGQLLAADARIGKVLLEPHLAARLNLTAPKFRFQGCRAARYDDHFHIQL
ncbi:MAG: hypothetical protein AAFY65_17080 [Pseudomonadota bacterium]